MPRSASDATRFTATGPYATAKPPTAASSLSIGAGAPANETPQQKIARLRAAAQQAKLGKESQFDKVVRVGRVWADRAHRTTAWGLIGLTVVCGVFATFAIGDMLMHNRRKRNEWLEDQQRKSAIALEEARAADSRGIATEDQRLLLNRERVAAAAEAERKAQTGMFSKARNAMFGADATRESSKEEKVMSEVRAVHQQKTQAATSGFLEDVETKAKTVISNTKASAESLVVSAQGGPLDRQADAATKAISNGTKSWVSWITGR